MMTLQVKSVFVAVLAFLSLHTTLIDGSDPIKTHEEINVKMYDSALIRCGSDQDKDYTNKLIIWKKDSTLLAIISDKAVRSSPKNPNYSVMNKRNIFIANVTFEDEALFDCNVNTQPHSEHTTQLNVLYAPKVTLKSSLDINSSISKGQYLTILCDVDGNPAPKVTWEKKDSNIVSVANLEIYFNKLAFTDLQTDSAGTYTCYAENTIGSVEKDVSIIVDDPPILEKEDSRVLTKFGETSVLTCFVYSKSRANLSWFSKQQAIPNSAENSAGINSEAMTKYQIKERVDGDKHYSDLNVNNVDESDIHEYKCVASNAFGSSEALILLQGVPDKVVISSDSNSNFSNTYLLEFSTRSKISLIEFIITLNTDLGNENTTILVPADSTQQDVYEQNYLLTDLLYVVIYGHQNTSSLFVSQKKRSDLEANTKYTVWMIAKNEFGNSEPLDAPFTFKTNIFQTGEVIDADTRTLRKQTSSTTSSFHAGNGVLSINKLQYLLFLLPLFI